MSRKYLSVRLNNQALNVYLILIGITLIGFWPLVTGHFSVKNDDIVYFLPYRYNIVESIRNGNFPLWNPYIYMGFPISGDMQSGVWNPFVWLLSLTGRYTLTTLHLELLIYVFLGGLGIFKIMSELQFRKIVCFTLAISYMFSGYMLDSGQILSWISCACFLPYTYLYIIRLFKAPALITCIKFAGSNYLLLVAGGYPFFFIANMYFLTIAFVIFLMYAHRRNELPNKMMALRYLLLSFILFSLVSAAPLLSFMDLLPYYSRGQGLSVQQALFNSYSPLSSISIIFPFAVTREHTDFGNNIEISRNIYVGILLLPFIARAIVKHQTIWLNTVFTLAIVAFALSLAQVLPFRKWAYLYLPLMNTFRHPANFRLFITIALLLIAGKGLDQFLTMPSIKERSLMLRIFWVIICCMIITAIWYFPSGKTLPFNNISLTSEGLKTLLDQISFRQGVFISLLMQLPFVITGIVLFKKGNYKWLCYLSIFNVIMVGQPQLFTGTAGKNPTFEINQFINNQAAGFPLPDLAYPVAAPDENTRFLYEYKEPLAYFFNKQVAINTLFNNPTILKSYNAFLKDKNVVDNIQNYPFVYIADSTYTIRKNISIKKDHLQKFWLRTKREKASSNNSAVSFNIFKPNKFTLTIKADTACSLVVLQNNFPGWNARVGNKSLPIQTINYTFMGIEIPAGTYDIHFSYRPGWFIPGMITSIFGVLLSILILLISLRKRRSYN